MCFIKSSGVSVSASSPQPDPVERHEANASITKNSQNENSPKGYLQNIKTSPVGLTDIADTEKKTLLGE